MKLNTVAHGRLSGSSSPLWLAAYISPNSMSFMDPTLWLWSLVSRALLCLCGCLFAVVAGRVRRHLPCLDEAHALDNGLW